MKKTMYEISELYIEHADYPNGRFVNATVTPIAIIEEGLLPGATLPTILAIGSDGRKFRGSESDFYETEEAAWAELRKNLLESIREEEKLIEHMRRGIDDMKAFLAARGMQDES